MTSRAGTTTRRADSSTPPVTTVATATGRSRWLRRWWVIGSCVVLGLALGLGTGLLLAAPGSTSSARLLVSGGGSPRVGSDSAYDSGYLDQRMASYAQLAASGDVLAAASRRLGVTVAALAPRVSASVDGGTTILTIAVRGSSPQAAVDGDRAVVDAARAAITTRETPVGRPALVTTTVISPPNTPVTRSLPSPGSFGVAGALAGLLLGLLTATVRAPTALRRAIAWARSEDRMTEAPPDNGQVPTVLGGPSASPPTAAPFPLGPPRARQAPDEAAPRPLAGSVPHRVDPPV